MKYELIEKDEVENFVFFSVVFVWIFWFINLEDFRFFFLC